MLAPVDTGPLHEPFSFSDGICCGGGTSDPVGVRTSQRSLPEELLLRAVELEQAPVSGRVSVYLILRKAVAGGGGGERGQGAGGKHPSTSP